MLEANLSRTDVAQYLNQPLPPTGRLAYVENLARDGIIGLDEAIQIIKSNPILEDETRQLYAESKRMLHDELGIDVPDDYTLKFLHRLDLLPFGNFNNGESNFEVKEIRLPEKGLSNIYPTISHEQAHAYHHENSKIFALLKDTYLQKKDLSMILQIKIDADFLIEGWACFIEELLVKMKDQKIGGNLHQMCRNIFRDEVYDWRQKLFSQFLYGQLHIPLRSLKYNGAELFNRIFEKKGFEAARDAANNLMTNEELIKFADSC